MMTDDLLMLLVVGSALAFAAGLPYVLIERRWRWRWQEVEAGRVAAVAGAGVYREAGVVPRYYVAAPRLICWAAFSCLLFGQMFVPALLVGLFGLMMAGLGLVSIPCLITSGKLYVTGLALLRREPRLAWFRAHDAAAWVLWLNGIILAGSAVLLALPCRPASHGALSLVAFVDSYAVLSILQALFVRYAVRRYEDAFFAPSARPFAR